MTTDGRELDDRAFGLACGLLWAVAVVSLGVLARFGWGERWEHLLADLYRGYGESTSGLAIGGLWAFLDGLVGGYVFAWLYNALVRAGETMRAPIDEDGVTEVVPSPRHNTE
ncbi:bacteriophage holin [Halobaculum marinum]|uniref:Bacteriophage holin n=1 Tax=Halobaculum marinum TaxID=3031996 RepID=A0ABD5WXE6_9EURY|nr:bacteriophage holin [Halobaculum sp. DT55]